MTEKYSNAFNKCNENNTPMPLYTEQIDSIKIYRPKVFVYKINNNYVMSYKCF